MVQMTVEDSGIKKVISLSFWHKICVSLDINSCDGSCSENCTFAIFFFCRSQLSSFYEPRVQ